MDIAVWYVISYAYIWGIKSSVVKSIHVGTSRYYRDFETLLRASCSEFIFRVIHENMDKGCEVSFEWHIELCRKYYTYRFFKTIINIMLLGLVSYILVSMYFWHENVWKKIITINLYDTILLYYLSLSNNIHVLRYKRGHKKYSWNKYDMYIKPVSYWKRMSRFYIKREVYAYHLSRREANRIFYEVFIYAARVRTLRFILEFANNCFSCILYDTTLNIYCIFFFVLNKFIILFFLLITI